MKMSSHLIQHYSGDFVINQSVSAGLVVQVDFDIPAGAITGASQNWLSRFRLLPTAPPFPPISYEGEALDGEVEDLLLDKPLNSYNPIDSGNTLRDTTS